MNINFANAKRSPKAVKTKFECQPLVISGLSAILLLFVSVMTTGAVTIRYNGKIAFTSDRDGNREIYVMNPDGTDQFRLTNSTDSESSPAFSPDGRKIAYISRQTSGASSGVIKIMNADGTNQTVLTTTSSVAELSWSPDGEKLAFVDAGEIFTIKINGSDRTNLTRNMGRDSGPAWSPDGSRILFIRVLGDYAKLHTMNSADGNDVKVLTEVSPFADDSSPGWSPAGARSHSPIHTKIFGRSSIPQMLTARIALPSTAMAVAVQEIDILQDGHRMDERSFFSISELSPTTLKFT